MNKLILYIAMSLDGYIAEKDGTISFLDETPSPSPDLGYENFYNSLQAIILGGKTYRQIIPANIHCFGNFYFFYFTIFYPGYGHRRCICDFILI